MKNELTFSESIMKEKQGTLRAMFYNIFGYKWFPDRANAPHLNSGPISLRQQMQMELINSYAPDVLGMQEYSIDYHKGMTPLLLDAGYREVEVGHSKTHRDGSRLNYTVLFYRPDTLCLIDQGFLMYPETMLDPTKNDGSVLDINDVSSKSLTWAVFEEIASKKRFVAICTHFMYSAAWLTPEQRDGTRVQNAQNLLNMIKVIRENPAYRGLPVVMGGDLNCGYASTPFYTLQKGGMEWLWDIAPVKDHSRGLKLYGTYDDTLEKYVAFEMPIEDPKTAIDYIWHMPADQGTQINFANYVTVTDHLALLSSDHCPRFTDFTLQ